jgi:hypothetical protein
MNEQKRANIASFFDEVATAIQQGDRDKIGALKIMHNHYLATLPLEEKYEFNLMDYCTMSGEERGNADRELQALSGSNDPAVKNAFLEDNILKPMRLGTTATVTGNNLVPSSL